MKIMDVSRPIFTNMTVWPGDEGVLVECTGSIANGYASNTSRIHAGVHTGTHVDAPFHFIDGGKRIDQLDISLFTGNVTVIDVKDENLITRRILQDNSLDGCKAVFFKTWYSNKTLNEPFDRNYPGLDPDAAEYLVKAGIRVVGTDALSVERYESDDFVVHKTLLRNEILVVEGLCLKEITPGKYKYICMPMLIEGSDGAPARVMLLQDE